jgi:HEAT repeat-containing taxis protein
LLLLPLVLAAPAWAQDQEPPSSRLLLPEDLEAASKLRKLEELGKRGQWDKVVLGLDRLLLEGGSKLVKVEGGFASVRAEARKRLLALQGRGRAAYLLAHEEEAKTLVRIGRKSSRPDPFERVLAEHPATPQAVRARRLVANRYLEQGNFGAALTHLNALLEDPRAASLSSEARRLRVLTLAFLGRKGAVASALDTVAEGERAQIKARAESILGSGGATLGPPPAEPGSLAWRRPVFGYYETESGGSQPWSTAQSDGLAVYVHDGSHAQSVDLMTGRVLWRRSLGEVDAFVRPEGRCTLGLGRSAVLCLEAKRLTALDQGSGDPIWQRPLTALQREAGVDFDASLATDTPPAIIGGTAVVALVTEHRDREVHLLGLSLETGKLLWSMFVAAETGGAIPRPALLAGGGRCFVVTGHGATAAVNGEGELLWVRTYASQRDAKRGGGGGRFPFGRGRRERPGATPALRSSLALAGGSLWIAPGDGKGFTALDPKDGSPRGGHAAKEARLIGVRGLGVVGLDLSASQTTRLSHIDRAELRDVFKFSGKPHEHQVAWSADRLYRSEAGRLFVHDLGLRNATEYKIDGTSRGSLVVAAGRVVAAAPSGLEAFGATPAPSKALGGEAEAILAALGDEGFLTREAASTAVLATGSVVTQELLIAAVGEREPEVALRATIALGELERRQRLVEWRPLTKPEWEGKVPDLLNRLTHPNPEVRLQALSALGKLEDPDVNTLLVELTEDRDQRVAFYGASALLEKGDRRGMRLVARALAGELPAPDRIKAARLLIDHGQPEDADLALPALADAEAEVRALAIHAALKLSEGRLLPQIEPLARDPDPSVRLALIEAVTDLVAVNARAKAIVSKAITDPDDRVRLAVVTRLAKLQTVDACRVLCRALGDSVRQTATIAAKAVNSELQRKVVNGRKLTLAEREARVLALVDPRGLEEGARHKEDFNRNFVAQLSLRYLDAGGRLSVETLCRFASDRRKLIRTYRIAGKPWAGFLLDAVNGKAVGRSDVAAIASLTLEKDPNTRIQAYQVLTSAGTAPGRSEVLVQGLGDEHPAVRRDVAGWLSPPLGKGKSLIDLPAARAILAMVHGDGREEGKAAARALLKSAGADRLAPHLIELVADAKLPNKSWVLATETLAALSKGKVPYDLSATRAEMAKRFRRWWFKTQHGEEGGDDLSRALQSKNPSERFMAARKAAKLPTPTMRRALIASLKDESTGWVLKEKLQALVKVSGRDFGFKRTLKLPELKACAQRFMAWEQAGAPGSDE